MDSLEYLQIQLDRFSENKIFVGLIMIMVNIGARFIIEELSDEQRAFIKNKYFRKVVIFCSVFMATRDIVIAGVITLAFAILMEEVLKTDETQTVEKSNGSNGSNGSNAKQELDKKIDELKLIKDSL